MYSFFFFNVQGSWLLATPTGSDISLIDIFWTFSHEGVPSLALASIYS